MKSFRVKVFVFVIGILLFRTAAASQPQDRAERMAQRLKDELSLTDEQYKQVKAIIEKNQDAARKEREKSSGDRAAMRGVIMKQMEKADTEIEKILVKDQIKKYQEIKKKRRHMMREQHQD